MNKRIGKLALAAVLMLTAGSALATQVFGVWGHGRTEGEARGDAISIGSQMCINQGYSGAWVEEVQTYPSGGGHITYGLAECS